jgi:hypothetical protein
MIVVEVASQGMLVYLENEDLSGLSTPELSNQSSLRRAVAGAPVGLD